MLSQVWQIKSILNSRLFLSDYPVKFPHLSPHQREKAVLLLGSLLLFPTVFSHKNLMFITLLSIVGIWTMFTEVVLVHDIAWCWLHPWINLLGVAVHPSYFLKNNAVVDCLSRILAPGKWSMVTDNNSWYSNWVDTTAFKFLDDD